MSSFQQDSQNWLSIMLGGTYGRKYEMASIFLFDDDVRASKNIENYLEKMGNNVVVINQLDELEDKISQIENNDIIIMDVVCRSKKLAQL